MDILNVLTAPLGARVRSPTNRIADPPSIVSMGTGYAGSVTTAAEKLSSVYAAINIRSGDIASLPNYIFNEETKERNNAHPVLVLLNVRPNVRMTPFVRRKVLEHSIYVTGNAYDWIIRDPVTRRPSELVPVQGDLVTRAIDKAGNIWYQMTHPITGTKIWLPQEDICDYKDATSDGINGLSVLTAASAVVQSGLAAQDYNLAFYRNGGQPSGVLTVDADLTGYEYDAENNLTGRTLKDVLREEWMKNHGGPDNSYKIAILDRGLKYQNLSISQRDAMFIEQQDQTVADIARYFNMPLYKLQAGKQSYNSNEQQHIEYSDGLRPSVLQREQEQSWKLLTPSEIAAGWRLRLNMMALLRSDSQSRGNYYQKMREVGAYNVDEIRAFEDMPPVEGGDEYAASLNYVPLKDWARLSIQRAGGKENSNGN